MDYLKNPFNYTGAKFKLLSQLLPLFPQQINNFYDIFGGSGEVSLNTEAKQVIYNEKNKDMSNLMLILSNAMTNNNFIADVDNVIKKYNLSKTNKEEFLIFRKWFNETTLSSYERAVSFYCLICFSFNNQYSFNSKYGFNTPFGLNRSSFNDRMRENLTNYITKFNEKNIIIKNADFKEIDIQLLNLGKDDFIYLDPPYYISVGAYERDYHCKWSKDNELALLNFMDVLNKKAIKFGLSNVIIHKGKTNELLLEWSKNYNVHYLDKNYNSCSYQTRAKGETQEVFITNY